MFSAKQCVLAFAVELLNQQICLHLYVFIYKLLFVTDGSFKCTELNGLRCARTVTFQQQTLKRRRRRVYSRI